MDQVLLGVKFTICRLDDISESSPEEHLQMLEEVLGAYNFMVSDRIMPSAFSFSQGLSFLDTGLTSMALDRCNRKWRQS